MIRVFWVDSQKQSPAFGVTNWQVGRDGICSETMGFLEMKPCPFGLASVILIRSGFCIGSFIYIEEVLSVQTNTNYMNQHMLMECSMVRIVLNVLIFHLTMTVEERAIVLLAKSNCISTTNNATLQKKQDFSNHKYSYTYIYSTIYVYLYIYM